MAAGIAVPGRIGAHGWSYGGYLTLVALTRWPDLFAAGVSLAGMSDLRTFFAGTEPWMAAASVTEYGDPVADRDMLAALSPMTALDRVSSPVLLAHGSGTRTCRWGVGAGRTRSSAPGARRWNCCCCRARGTPSSAATPPPDRTGDGVVRSVAVSRTPPLLDGYPSSTADEAVEPDGPAARRLRPVGPVLRAARASRA